VVVVTRRGGREVKYDTDERRKVNVCVVVEGERKEGETARMLPGSQSGGR